jgi:hypothetical protein
MLQRGVSLSPADLTVPEFAALEIIWTERERWEGEERKRVEYERRRQDAIARKGL